MHGIGPGTMKAGGATLREVKAGSPTVAEVRKSGFPAMKEFAAQFEEKVFKKGKYVRPKLKDVSKRINLADITRQAQEIDGGSRHLMRLGMAL